MSFETAQAIISWLQPVWTFMQLLGVLIGFVTAAFGLLTAFRGAAETGQMHNPKSRIGWVGVVIGTFLANLPAALDTLSLTIFNQTTQSAIAYGGTGGGQYAEIEHAVLGIVSLVGLYGIITGFLLLRNAHENRDHFWHGIRRLIGGTLAVNIVPALTVLGASLGTTMQSVITRIIS